MGQRGTSFRQLDEFILHWIDGIFLIHDDPECEEEVEVPDKFSAADFIDLILDHTCTSCPGNHQHGYETLKGFNEVLFWKTGVCNVAIN